MNSSCKPVERWLEREVEIHRKRKMTWFKSLIMRQKSPLLLIDSNPIRKSSPKDKPFVSKSREVSMRSTKSNIGQLNGRQAPRLAQVRSKRSDWAHPEGELAESDQFSRKQQQQKQPQEITQQHKSPHLVQTGCQEHPTRVCDEAQTTFGCSRESIPDEIIASNQCELISFATSQKELSSSSNEHQINSTSRNQQQEMRAQMSAIKEQMPEYVQYASQRRLLRYGSRRRRTTIAANRAFSNAISTIWPYRAHLLLAGGLLLLLTIFTSFASAAGSGQQYFEVQPDAQYLVHNGHDVRIRCLIRNRQGECLWLRNGRAIGTIAKKYQFTRQPEDGDCSLMIRNVSVQQDDGQWQCQVTASDVEQDTLQSREVHLVVLVAPERPQIKNTSAQSTQRIILEENKTKFVVCEMRGGNPAPQIEWILDNKNMSKEAQTSSFLVAQSANTSQRITQSKLKMSDIKRTMNGKNLTCIGVHQTMNQSTSVELDVQYVPTVSVNQREYSIVEGSPLSISCQVDSNPPPNIVNWRLVSDGASVSNGKGGSITLPTRPGPVLEFERISRDLNQNTFECLAQNSYGISMPADVKLNVLYAPVVLNTSNSDSVALGSEAQLACIFDGNPEPEVKWLYTDPLSRSSQAMQLENNKQQYLNIKNVTYRNEGDYHCEARNQINGVYYAVRSSNIILDIFGEPQFLVKSPLNAKAVQGTKSDISLAFCSDPFPNKVYWQFGSLRLDVRLNNINNGQQPIPSHAAPSASAKLNPVSARFQAHPLQSIYKRESSFSKVPSCFEAQLSILDPELTDQRDYLLIVQNERGHQSASVRLRVTSPLSPVLMITSAFVTICALFLLSLVVMFLIKKTRHRVGLGSGVNGTQNGANGVALNGREKSSVEHLVNGNGHLANTAAAVAAATAAAAAAANGQLMQQTRGIVNGAGNGLANGASNPAQNQTQASSLVSQDELKNGQLHLMSMASSDTSGDQKQLLFSSSDRNSSASGSTSTNQCIDFNVNSAANSSTCRSSANSTPVPLNHISVEQDELQLQDVINGVSSTYQAGECVTRDAQLSPQLSHLANGNGALIYANLDYTDQQANLTSDHQRQTLMSTLKRNSPRQHSSSMQQVAVGNNNNSSNNKHNLHQLQPAHQRRQQTPMEHSPAGSSLSEQSSILQASQSSSQSSEQAQMAKQQSPNGIRSNVGATIAMMNSLAAASQNQPNSALPNSGALNGAINQQLANNRLIRKPGPPKPPKPSIQQRSRFYQQQHNGATNGLVMIGSPAAMSAYQGSMTTSDQDDGPSANELSVELSRIHFPARAEL